jgi:hypothetical protein
MSDKPLEDVVDSVLDNHVTKVTDYYENDGPGEALNFLVGVVLEETDGGVGPNEAKDALLEELRDVEKPEYPIEVTIHRKEGEIAMLEQLANEIRDRTYLPIESVGTPTKVRPPTIGVTYRVYEDGEIDVVGVEY